MSDILSLKFTPGVKVYFKTMVHGKNIPRPGAWTSIRINKGAIGQVMSYDKKNTPDDVGDDWIKVKILEGDEGIGTACYIPIGEFISGNIVKRNVY
ncbi:MAG: hypothetical protein ACTSRA_14720 [Promethearchaeota archaeon]